MKDRNLHQMLSCCALFLVGFVCLDHLLVMTAFLVSSTLLPFAFPAALVIALLLSVSIGRQQRLGWAVTVRFLLVGLAVIAVSLPVCDFFFDLSWDGQWYHQAAIYNMVGDWNPLQEPVRAFDKSNDLSILHFPKGSWYFAASVYSTFGHFEAGKALNLIVLFATGFATAATMLNFGWPIAKSLLVTLAVLLNPVVCSELTTYLVDGLLALYLTLYIATLVDWIYNRTPTSLLLLAMAFVCIVNVKFTGLVFVAVIATFAAIYLCVFFRKLLLPFLKTNVVSLLLATTVFGYNPYLTNLIHFGHPLYPIMGTAERPDVFKQTGQDDNELYETPHNIQGKSLPVRMFLAYFGKPGNAPYNKETDAVLTLPFQLNWADWNAYRYHETRVAGFGPLFSGLLVLSVLGTGWLLYFIKELRWPLLFLLVALGATVLFSRHFWWPRLVPQVWLLPLIPLILLISNRHSRKGRICGWCLLAPVLINSSIVLFVHLKWEIQSTLQLRNELTALQHNKVPIEVSYRSFKRSMKEKLDRWHILHTDIPVKQMKKGPYQTLTSVVEGYPGAVLYRYQ